MKFGSFSTFNSLFLFFKICSLFGLKFGSFDKNFRDYFVFILDILFTLFPTSFFYLNFSFNLPILLIPVSIFTPVNTLLNFVYKIHSFPTFGCPIIPF